MTNRPLVVRDRILEAVVSRFNDLPRVCTRELSVDLLLVTNEVEESVSLESELKTTLVKYYVECRIVAVHFASSEHTLSRDTCASTDCVNILICLSILSEMSVSLSAVEDHLTPTADNRRRKHWVAILVRELRNVVDWVGVTVLHSLVNTSQAVYALVVNVVLIVLAVDLLFLYGISLTAISEGIVVTIRSNYERKAQTTRSIVSSLRIWEIDCSLIQQRIWELCVDEAGVTLVLRITLVEVEQW